MATQAIAAKLRRFFPSESNRRMPTWFFYYGVAILTVVAALGITRLLDSLLRGTPAALFYVAVMVSSWLGGLGPGLCATGLSTFAISYFFWLPLIP
jgi:K+-sensing histidine kinase KdpD